MAKAKKTEIALTLEEKFEQTLVPDWEQPYKVPENWCWCKLPALCEYIRAGGDKPKIFSNEKMSTLTVPVVANGISNDGIVGFTSEADEKAGSITVSGRGTIGFSVIRDYPYYPIVRLIVIRPKRTVLPEYIKYAFDHFIEQGTGTSIPQLTVPMLKDKFIPLPPLAEQQRIVDRIERMFSKLDEVKENVQNVIDGFENRKSAILHKAFNGELTAKWRKEKGKTIDGWRNECLKNLLYPMQAKKPTGEFFRYIDIDSIDNKCQKVREPKIVLVSEAPSRASRTVKKNSVLFSMVRPYLKNIALISKDLSDCIASTGFYVCDCKKEMLPIFLYEFLRSDDAINYLMQFMKGDNSPSIRKDDLLGMKVLLPTIEEQNEIVRILNEIMFKEQQTKENAEEVLERIELIKKSILARAFRGELGTNNPDEESSIELLKNILNDDKDEKTSSKPKSKRVSIPAEVKALLSNHLEKDIITLFYKAESNEVSIDDIMSVSSNKFEIMDALKALEEKKLISKKSDGIYKLAR